VASAASPLDQVDIEQHDPEEVVYFLGAHATLSGSNQPSGFRNPWAASALGGLAHGYYRPAFQAGNREASGLAHGYCRPVFQAGNREAPGRRCEGISDSFRQSLGQSQAAVDLSQKQRPTVGSQPPAAQIVAELMKHGTGASWGLQWDLREKRRRRRTRFQVRSVTPVVAITVRPMWNKEYLEANRGWAAPPGPVYNRIPND